MDPRRQLLQHFLGAIAYRTQKAVRDAPTHYAEFRAAPGVRTPHELVRHMTSVLGYARTYFTGGVWRPGLEPTFEREVTRFHEVLADLSHHLDGSELRNTTPERLLQGPLADVMTHVGQLAMLRRLAGAPIPPEDFIDADIDATNVGPVQPPPVSPDAEWHAAEDEPR